MYYKLNKDIALRKWKFVERAVYIKGVDHALGVSEEEFKTLLLCDGKTDIEKCGVTESLIAKGYISECEKGDEVSEWSKLIVFDNMYYPRMNLMITGKCNLNCLHCFNARDNAPLNSELKYEEILKLLDEARDIGVHAFTITGGEPLVHPKFMDIIKSIYERDMFVFELNTNGLLITQKMLDEFKKIGCFPLMKISYDGIGYHNWMRQNPKAEDKTVNAIKLCIENGFRVKAQTQVNKKNISVMFDTAKYLNGLGVEEMRIIRTTEAPRWEENCPDSTIPVEEYYGEMLAFAREYKNSGMRMTIDIWQFMTLYPDSRSYMLKPIKTNKDEFSIRIPMCKGNRGMIAVSSSGEVVPCLQMSGYFMEKGISLANMKERSLKEIITKSDYCDIATAPLLSLIIKNDKCASCKYIKACAGGCPALGLLYSNPPGNMFHEDVTKCVFFENGWYDRVLRAMDDWKLTNPLNI